MRIDIIGSIVGESFYQVAQIQQLLEKNPTKLSHGTSFMGRPGTRLHVGTDTIVKLRNELNLDQEKASYLLARTLKKEQQLHVYHPHKTWFLVEFDNHTIKIGSICPRLTPLHLKTFQPSKRISHLKRVYQLYFRVACDFKLRLDEGLSNFGVDAEDKLYYLDDDLYTWDHFISFSHYLGVLVRNNSWLDSQVGQEFGAELQRLINEFFDDSHSCYRVAKLLRDIFMPTSERKKILHVIIDQLVDSQRVSQKLKPNKSEYLAILSDVHANLPALEAVLTYLQQHQVTEGIVLGDIVGYGPHPSECITRLQQTNFAVIKGNHDHAAINGNMKRNMSPSANWCIDWTIPRLSAQQKQWLTELPLELSSSRQTAKNWLAMHGSPIDPNYFYAYVYQMTYEKNLDLMEKKQIDVCFHGHTHIQGMYVRDKSGQDGFVKPKEEVDLEKYPHALICSGSIGQPRNGYPGTQFALYHQQTHKVRFLTIDYDMDKTLMDLQQHSFPEGLGERLLLGQ